MFRRRKKEINYDKLLKKVKREPGTLPTFLFGDAEKQNDEKEEKNVETKKIDLSKLLNIEQDDDIDIENNMIFPTIENKDNNL